MIFASDIKQPAAIAWQASSSQTKLFLTNIDVISLTDEPYMTTCSHAASRSLKTSQSTGEEKKVAVNSFCANLDCCEGPLTYHYQACLDLSLL